MDIRRWLPFGVIVLFTSFSATTSMSSSEKSSLRDEAKEMFLHAFHSYMSHAYPADELKPLSCAGRFRGVDASRGDVDDAMGNFAMTLIDSLDTLVVMNEIEEFSKSIRRVIEDVTFTSDIVVSVFETNIRVLGGLLSAHDLASSLQARGEPLLSWYTGQLLHKAQLVGERLSPAFQTKTGIPYPRINLRWGLSDAVKSASTTCTACAGTMLLEFATLSRLTGNATYEILARKAMDAIWQRRSPHLLVGTTIDIHTGEWKEQDSGVGAGIDSYYEYCFKAYTQLGDGEYLDRFKRHYASVMSLTRRGNTLIDVHMYNPANVAQSFVDSLGAFWPGLQVSMGDVSAAADLFSHMEGVVKRHKFMPEAYNTDGEGYWWHHFLRPEYTESAYFLHQATRDDHYLEIGKAVLKNIQQYARVDCGFAAFSDLRTLAHDDRMDSFVLAETFKYLYLLFASKSDLPIDLDKYVFSTEAHLLPISVAKNVTGLRGVINPDFEVEDTCANVKRKEKTNAYFAARKLAESPAIEPAAPQQQQCYMRKTTTRKLTRLLPANMDIQNEEHRVILGELGITISPQDNGQVHFFHNTKNAATPDDAEEGVAFMQALIDLNNKIQSQAADIVYLKVLEPADTTQFLPAGAARFGPSVLENETARISGELTCALPANACDPLESDLTGHIALVERGACMFVQKVLNAEAAGAIGVVVYDTADSASSQHLSMTGNGTEPSIPSAFLLRNQVVALLEAMDGGIPVKVKFGTEAMVQEANASGGDKSEAAAPGAADAADPEQDAANSSGAAGQSSERGASGGADESMADNEIMTEDTAP